MDKPDFELKTCCENTEQAGSNREEKLEMSFFLLKRQIIRLLKRVKSGFICGRSAQPIGCS